MAISVSQAFKDAFKGPIDRTKLKVEIYFSALLGWVDVTPWVESISGSQEELSGLTRGASANTLSLTLNNDDGRFSRKNAASPYYAAGKGLVPNKPIQVSAVYGGESVRVFTGNTGPWNTNARARTCSISAQDPARLMRDLEVEPEILMDPANPGQGYYLTRVIERAAWLSGLRWDAVTTKAAEWTSTAHGGTITPTYNGGVARATYTQGGALVMTLDLVDLRLPVAELKGHALELISKLAQVVDGTVYFDAQGQLVFRARMYRNDSTIPVAETFTVSNLEDVTAQANFEQSQFAPLINKATVTSTPLAPVLDATGAWTEQEIIVSAFVKTEFDTGESYPGPSDPDLFIAFPDGIRIHREPGYPSAANVTLRSSYSEDTTRELNGIGFTGGTPIFFPEAIKVAFKNNGIGKERLKEMVIRVKHFKAVEGCRGVAENAESQALYGQRAVDVSNDFIPTVAACEQLAAWKVEDGREVKDQLDLTVMYGMPWLEIGDRIKVSETISRTIPVEEEFIVKRIAWSWTLAGFMFSIEACTPSPNFSAGSLPPTATITETANVNLSAAVKGGLPPQTIDGTASLVGMNNVPAFADVARNTKAIAIPGYSGFRDIVCDGSDLYVVAYKNSTSERCVIRVDTMSGAKTAETITEGFYELAVGSATNGDVLLFGANASSGKLIVKSALNFSGAWGVKADLSGSGRGVADVVCAGDRMAAVVIDVSAPDLAFLLAMWDEISDARDDTPDAIQQVFSEAGGFSFQGLANMTASATHAYCAVRTRKYEGGDYVYRSPISRINLETGAVEAEYIVIDSTVVSIAHDGIALWATLFDPHTSTGKLVRILDTAGGPVILDAALDAALGPVNHLAFDGSYVTIANYGNIIQFSPAGAIVAKYRSTGATKGAFDGIANWYVDDFHQDALIRVPRIVSGRQF